MLSPLLTSMMIEKAVVNVIATADLQQKINLKEIKEFRDIVYDDKVYRGMAAYFKTSLMQGRVSIFSSGKMISVGTRSEKRAFSELERAKGFLVDQGIIKPTKLRPIVNNIVAKANMNKDIDLEGLSQSTKMMYEPEQFPGGILKIQEPLMATFLIFASGKVVVTGIKKMKQVEQAIQKLTAILEDYMSSQ